VVGGLVGRVLDGGNRELIVSWTDRREGEVELCKMID
jgi:hypothetical protein